MSQAGSMEIRTASPVHFSGLEVMADDQQPGLLQRGIGSIATHLEGFSRSINEITTSIGNRIPGNRTQWAIGATTVTGALGVGIATANAKEMAEASVPGARVVHVGATAKNTDTPSTFSVKDFFSSVAIPSFSTEATTSNTPVAKASKAPTIKYYSVFNKQILNKISRMEQKYPHGLGVSTGHTKQTRPYGRLTVEDIRDSHGKLLYDRFEVTKAPHQKGKLKHPRGGYATTSDRHFFFPVFHWNPKRHSWVFNDKNVETAKGVTELVVNLEN